jgi:hypothetical protein
LARPPGRPRRSPKSYSSWVPEIRLTSPATSSRRKHSRLPMVRGELSGSRNTFSTDFGPSPAVFTTASASRIASARPGRACQVAGRRASRMRPRAKKPPCAPTECRILRRKRCRNSPFSPCRKCRALCIGVFGGEGVIGEQMCFASCAQDLDSREDTSADPILAADAGITPSGLIGACVTDFAARFPRTRDVRRSAVRRTSQKRQHPKFGDFAFPGARVNRMLSYGS